VEAFFSGDRDFDGLLDVKELNRFLRSGGAPGESAQQLARRCVWERACHECGMLVAYGVRLGKGAEGGGTGGAGGASGAGTACPFPPPPPPPGTTCWHHPAVMPPVCAPCAISPTDGVVGFPPHLPRQWAVALTHTVFLLTPPGVWPPQPPPPLRLHTMHVFFLYMVLLTLCMLPPWAPGPQGVAMRRPQW
jgi:hypothetical protein